MRTTPDAGLAEGREKVFTIFGETVNATMRKPRKLRFTHLSKREICALCRF